MIYSTTLYKSEGLQYAVHTLILGYAWLHAFDVMSHEFYIPIGLKMRTLTI